MIGEGGMAAVFEAEYPVLKRRVAIKIMKPQLAGDAEGQGRFLIEAQAAAGLRNDHVVSIHQVGEENGMPFLVMPLLRGETLQARLKRAPRPTLPESVKIGREIAAGLTAAHTAGLIHRDIKPGNIWLEAPNGRALILDFGLARAGQAGGELTRQGQVLGTPAFMAPEQARGHAVDFRADLFSLGAVLYEMTTGRQSFSGDDVWSVLYKVVNEYPVPPAEINSAIPAALSDLVMRLLAKEPDARPKSAAAVVMELHSIRLALAKKRLIRPMRVLFRGGRGFSV